VKNILIKTTLKVLFWVSILFVLIISIINLDLLNLSTRDRKNFAREFVYLISITYMFLYSTVVKYKSFINKKYLLKAYKKDKIWNENNLCKLIEKVVIEYYDAIQYKNLEKFKKLSTNNFYLKVKNHIDDMIKKKQYFIYKNYENLKISFVEIDDFINNNRDSFKVFLKFNMISYYVGSDGLLCKGSHEKQELTQIWEFKRFKNIWLIDNLFNNPEISDFILLKSYCEE
jgi:hypothetical protein